ncbi:MAG: HAMP domain-containing protein, partial [Candidatus Binatia bacterium]
MDTQDKLVTKSAPVKAKPKSRNGTGNGGRRYGNRAVNLLEHEIELGQCYSALLGYRNGDFTARLPHTWSGPLGKIAEVMNEIMISSARRASETSRISRVVGEEGKLRERFSSAGLFGGWADEIASLNRLIDDLVSPTAEVTRAVGAVAKGDLAQSIALYRDGRPLEGEFLTSAKLVNTMIEQLSVFASEVTRVAREVGADGKLGGQAQVSGVSGVWKDLTESVNSMASNLTAQVRNISEVTIAVANGDLSRKITVDVRGEILQLKEAINTMVDQLRSFASEVTRVAREVGTEGKLGGQAVVPGVAGTWKDLTDNVNLLAGNLTQRLTVQAKGEVAALADTINGMTDTLATFADQVTNVAREVGVDGRLGGQANVPGAAGTWKDLTGNVNLLAANLTTQVRAIAEVATAVTKGDLTRSIQVDAKGEVSELKDNINTMISNLRETTESNREQDW